MVVLGCGEKIDSEDGQRIRFERREFFFFFFFFGFYVLSGFSEKKNQSFFFIKKKNNADVKNCDASRSFGYIYNNNN